MIKLVNGKNDIATFLSLKIKGGSYIRSSKDKNSSKSHIESSKYENSKYSKIPKLKPTRILTEDQAKIICNKVSTRQKIDSHTIQKEMMSNLEVNSYKDARLKESNRKGDPLLMEEWSILSDHVKYVMHDESEAFQKLSIDLMSYRQNRDLYKRLNSEEILKTSLNFGKSPEKLKSDNLDVYKGVYAKVISADRFDEDTDLSTTYLGQVAMARDTKVKAEESFPMTARGYTKGQLLDGTDCEILIGTGTSKSYMSKSYFLQCKNFQAMPKFTPSTRRIQVGNGQYVGVLFVIPVIINIKNHRFEIFTLVSEIHKNVDLVLGIKNLFELEVVIDSYNSCLSFLNRSIPFFPKEKVEVQLKEQKLMVL